MIKGNPFNSKPSEFQVSAQRAHFEFRKEVNIAMNQVIETRNGQQFVPQKTYVNLQNAESDEVYCTFQVDLAYYCNELHFLAKNAKKEVLEWNNLNKGTFSGDGGEQANNNSHDVNVNSAELDFSITVKKVKAGAQQMMNSIFKA